MRTIKQATSSYAEEKSKQLSQQRQKGKRGQAVEDKLQVGFCLISEISPQQDANVLHKHIKGIGIAEVLTLLQLLSLHVTRVYAACRH